MNKYEAIIESIRELNRFFIETGELNSEQYCKLLEPLHNALIKDAKPDYENLTSSVVGESLRELFFDPKLGYQNFKVRPEAEELPNTPWYEGKEFHTYQLNDIIMMYHGDGTLVFVLPSGRVIANNGKNNHWRSFDNWNSFSYSITLYLKPVS